MIFYLTSDNSISVAEQSVAFALGIVGSIVATGLIWLTGTYIVPSISRRLSDDVSLAGTWQGRVTLPEAQYTYHSDLKPRFRGWGGSATITRTSVQLGDYTHAFSVEARKRGSHVVLTLFSADDRRRGMAAGLFHLQGRGSTMRGDWVYLPSKGEEPETEHLTLVRN